MPKLLGCTLCRRLKAARGLLPEDWQDTLRMAYQGCLLRPIVPHLVHTIVSPSALSSCIFAQSGYSGMPCFHSFQWVTTSLMKGAEAAHRFNIAGS
jgi:hypothetical protein